VIVEGRYALLLPDDPAIYAFTRTSEQDRLLVILNFTAGTPQFVLPGELPAERAGLLISNYDVELGGDIRQITLRPYEARVYRLKPE